MRLQAAVTASEFDGLLLERRRVASAPTPRPSIRRVREAEAAAHAGAVDADRARAAAQAFTTAARGGSDAAAPTTTRLRHRAGPVVHLAKLARGVAGQRRVNLTTYVLRQWFEQVVAAANVRLAGMSSGRYELVRVDEGASQAPSGRG